MKSRVTIIIILSSIILISGCATGLQHIELSASSFDMGDINPDEGLRTESFTLKNTGGQPLDILSVSTSCGCTSAYVGLEHILPGEETKLTVTYDPSVHPGLTGKIKRVVYIQSNDPTHEEIELELTGNMLPSSSEKNIQGNLSKKHDDNLREFEISPSGAYDKLKDKKAIFLDVRESWEYEESHIDGARLLPLGKITEDNLKELGIEKDDGIIIYCRSGKRSAEAYGIMKDMGYSNIKSMNGGIVHWSGEGFSVIEGDATENDPVSMSIPEGE